MTLNIVWLTSHQGQTAIHSAHEIGADPNDIEKFRKQFPDVEPDLIGSAIHQSWLRKRAQLRWGIATDFLLTTDGLAQATRPEVSKLHAQIATTHFGANLHIIDLTCGLGFDALAFAQAGHRVTALERDEEIAEIARYNLREHDVEVICTDATEYNIPSDAAMVFVDPARRDPQAAKSISGESKRVGNPEKWSPRWSFVQKISQHVPVMAKVAPGIDDASIGDWCAGFISFQGDLVEALLTSFDTGRVAVLMDAEGTQRFIGGQETDVFGLGNFLIVPDPGLVRARALNVIAHRVNGGLINPHISWLATNDEKSALELTQESIRLGQVFHVLERVSFTPKLLKQTLSQHAASAVTIMTRGVDINVEELRKKISPPLQKSAAELVVAIYREDSGNQAIIARRIR